MTNLHETDRLVERLSSALKGYDEAVVWHSYRPHDVNREREQHAAAAVLADELRTALPTLTAMGGKAEPDGWQLWTGEEGSGFTFETERVHAEQFAKEGGRITALYASPVQARTGEVTEAMVARAEAAVYPRHERGFLSKPLIDPIDMRKALEAALSEPPKA